MKPGREIDALVAEKVMGLSPHIVYGLRWVEGGITRASWGYSYNFLKDKCAHYNALGDMRAEIVSTTKDPSQYSTDTACAWLIVEKLSHLHFSLEGQGNHWVASFDSIDDGDIHVQAEAETPMHAICLAALEATEKP